MFKPKRILVPTDFSASSRAALEHAAELAERYGSTLVALHVWEPPTLLRADDSLGPAGEPYHTLGRMARRRANAEMDAFLLTLVDRQGLWFRRQIEMGHPAETILRVAAEGEYDLVVMGTHGRSGLRRLLLGSVSEEVVRHAVCPVLTIHEPAPVEIAANGSLT